ncbi:MAG: ATP-binding cassette domain-containing protein [Gemmatimonadetes bacterium]|nr:ABC transporter ATP-binding protein [Gemmatimonadota bacterium]NIQ53030.1 ABC transporter ATP-binding protein [Gemmatimonadota bacterium]NIU73174.1 ATP-binding cassette domain-containing protein [Gammaproteobacteria bacterium]NIX43468.1 ATP-binding cassette domain-containing protein [Gemmatimonadota bacterium]NIY07642.1 ATP-binding cassette domain-containing protein [Gemmatimonadota bacterium]
MIAERGEPAVAVRELTRRFGDFTAVDGVTFEVPDGEIFGFLGPNGAGKTTTIKMLIGLLAPSTGTATVAGLDVTRHGPELRQKIGYMSQKFSLYGDLTVDENIELFAGLYGVTGPRFRERRAWVLSMAGLEGQDDRLTAELPLGWKQRLALGCAVLHEPPILLLDEPTSGVDPLARRRFWDLIDELAAGGTTVLVSTHYMEEAEYCHRLALMNRGRLIALDTPAALRESLELPLYEVGVADPPRGVEALRAAPGVLEAAMFGRTLHVLTEAEAEDAIRRVLTEAGLEPGFVERSSPSLEDVFVALVRREGGAREG